MTKKKQPPDLDALVGKRAVWHSKELVTILEVWYQGDNLVCRIETLRGSIVSGVSYARLTLLPEG